MSASDRERTGAFQPSAELTNQEHLNVNSTSNPRLNYEQFILVDTSQADIDQTAEQQAAMIAEDWAKKLLCPHCGSQSMRLVEVLAPPEEAEQTRKVARNGVGGSIMGAILGAPFGPYGVAAGVALFRGVVAVKTAERVAEPTVVAECTNLGCEGVKEASASALESSD